MHGHTRVYVCLYIALYVCQPECYHATLLNKAGLKYIGLKIRDLRSILSW